MSLNNDQAQYSEIIQALAAAAQEVGREKGETLAELKSEYHRLEQTGFLWFLILQSASTLGGSNGSKGLIDNKDNYNRVAFEALVALSGADRIMLLEEVLRLAKVRYPEKKSKELSYNVALILDMGGLKAAEDKLLSQEGRAGKIKFLKLFKGIGDKYSRNMMMDVYHPDFRDSIALDSRLKEIAEKIGLPEKARESYEGLETFYLEVAHQAGLEGWELDRLLYQFKTEILTSFKNKRVG
ncbi:MAG: hypothetical protein HXX08_14425 [Chloroflexi bacterium]|uniref:Uncharacterized protein n=1 Tax=Candidatus Chlorohelix allophototropha TaxID=3003348 RepID=A0A8T7M4P8_9CHLR|nr:hypothetical protein [Chloroflexota bacterium]WJW70367.1 hypothetical protein OZ401_004941 [Chloroflexota bacterium L227-S17]